jgi:type II secretory pathway pseudopilin PulG
MENRSLQGTQVSVEMDIMVFQVLNERAMFVHPPVHRRWPRGSLAFTLVELMVTISVVAFATSGIMVLSSRVFNLLKSANNTTLASQTL